ncbi:MAG: hypothetical protein IT514_00815, partial [Burkholderiales bacterium]|nr:hypothetical protein [Burkholderiales bacterium]
KTLLSGGWDVGLYGVYTTPIPPFESAFQPALYAEYQRLKPAPLGFDFGYNHRDRRNGRALVMIARKPAPVLAGRARAAIRISASPLRP